MALTGDGQEESPDLRGFLEWLDEYTDGESDCYRDLLNRLVMFFIGRNQLDPDECAALTLHTAAMRYRSSMRRSYDHPRKFVLGVARNVNFDMLRRTKRHVALDERIERAQPPPIDKELESELVQECVRLFGRDNVTSVVAYYESVRKGGSVDGATRTRMCRLKSKMKGWMEKRLSGMNRRV